MKKLKRLLIGQNLPAEQYAWTDMFVRVHFWEWKLAFVKGERIREGMEDLRELNNFIIKKYEQDLYVKRLIDIQLRWQLFKSNPVFDKVGVEEFFQKEVFGYDEAAFNNTAKIQYYGLLGEYYGLMGNKHKELYYNERQYEVLQKGKNNYGERGKLLILGKILQACIYTHEHDKFKSYMLSLEQMVFDKAREQSLFFYTKYMRLFEYYHVHRQFEDSLKITPQFTKDFKSLKGVLSYEQEEEFIMELINCFYHNEDVESALDWLNYWYAKYKKQKDSYIYFTFKVLVILLFVKANLLKNAESELRNAYRTLQNRDQLADRYRRILNFLRRLLNYYPDTHYRSHIIREFLKQHTTKDLFGYIIPTIPFLDMLKEFMDDSVPLAVSS